MIKTKKYRLFEVLIYVVLLILAFFLQSTSLIFSYSSPAPSMVFAVVLIISLFENYWFSAIFGLAGGILIDSISANGVGFHALIYMLLGFFCSIVLEAFLQNNFAAFAVVSAPVILIHQFLEIIINSGFVSGIFKLFVKFHLLACIYTFAAAFILYLLFYFIIKKDERFKNPIGIIKTKK